MAVTVDWAGTASEPYRIFIPRADMTLVQASPEIRELDIDTLRHELRTLEADVEGAPWPETHVHQAAVTLSGIVYSEFFTVLAPYTVTFEDGQYTVRIVGANHNIGDVKNPNQVSIIVNNSAGLIQSPSQATLEARLQDVWQLLGLDSSSPLHITPTSQQVGGVSIVMTKVGNLVTVTRS